MRTAAMTAMNRDRTCRAVPLSAVQCSGLKSSSSVQGTGLGTIMPYAHKKSGTQSAASEHSFGWLLFLLAQKSPEGVNQVSGFAPTCLAPAHGSLQGAACNPAGHSLHIRHKFRF